MVLPTNTQSIVEFFNSDFINGVANISQFYNIYQSTKAGTYAQMNHNLDLQTNELEKKMDEQTKQIVNQLIDYVKKSVEQNEIIIQQNNQIILLLKGGK